MDMNATEIILLVDRSGSMSTTKKDAEGGIAAFFEDQKKQPGKAYCSLAQFDTEFEWVHVRTDLRYVPPYTLHPRSNTALLDAVGRAVTQAGERLAALPEAERPGLVVCVIVTDGQENASREYSKAKIKEMIEHQQKVFSWKFVYLGANQDAFAEAGGMGIPQAAALNYAASNAKGAYIGASANVARMRASAAAGQAVACSFTDDERAAAK